jgi:hypothetical protein
MISEPLQRNKMLHVTHYAVKLRQSAQVSTGFYSNIIHIRALVFFAYFPYFGKKKVGLQDLAVSVSVCVSHLTFEFLNQSL